MSNIFTCPKCNRNFIAEEAQYHKCVIPIKKIVDIEYDWWIKTVIDGKDFLVILDKEGNIYRINPSNRDLTGEKNNRRPNSSM